MESISTATPRVTPIQVLTRLEPRDFERLEQWRRQQQCIPSRSDALRALLRQALGGDAIKPGTARGAP
jgi:hypothetical protein